MSVDSDPQHQKGFAAPPRATSLIVLAALLIFVLVIAPDVMLVIFTGLLFGVFFGGGGDWLAKRLGVHRILGIGLFILAILLVLVGLGVGFAPMVAEQFEQLVEQVPQTVEELRGRLEQYTWGQWLLEHGSPAALMSNGDGSSAAGAVSSTFGAFGNFVIMLITGLYVALTPKIYNEGLIAMLAPSLRSDGQEVLDKAHNTLKNWLVAQLMAMTVVGVLTWLGLWAVGVPLAPVLGLIAALLAFIPNIGPILAAVPAVLLGFAEGQTTALLVVGIYVAVQALESYVVTPLIQQEKVSLPPVLIISAQLLMGTMFGILGLALATPLAALGLTLVRETYVHRYLERETGNAPQDIIVVK